MGHFARTAMAWVVALGAAWLWLALIAHMFEVSTRHMIHTGIATVLLKEIVYTAWY
jgi:hypothetical protein